MAKVGKLSSPFEQSFMFHMIRDFFLLLIVVAGLELAIRYAVVVYDFKSNETQRVERAAQQFDHVVVAVLENRTKSSLFTVQERISMITEVVAKFPNVSVDSWSGLLVDYCKSNSIQAIVKGLRAVSDFDYELQMAQVNLQGSGVETMFMATAPTHSFLSSSLVKELAHYNGDVSTMVPPSINEALKLRIAGK